MTAGIASGLIASSSTAVDLLGSEAQAYGPQGEPDRVQELPQFEGRIRMYVYISNETEVALTLSGEDLDSGEYTDGWHPHQVIPPGQRLGFEGEGDLAFGVPTSGTEGRVRYNIDAPDGGELYIHWNSPLIESSYDNTFHVWAPPGWEVTHSGGQGHRATLEIRLRRTALRSVPNFHPHGRGFKFRNSWSGDLPVISIGYLWNRLFESQPGPLQALGYESVLDEDFGPITHADSGLCGGMVYTVMDYYANHLLPPELTTSPVSRDDSLFQYVRDRLWDSFDVNGEGSRFLGYSSPLYPNGDEGVLQVAGLARGRSWVTYREAFPQIQQDIDAGRLSPMGLIQSDNFDIGKNHQVLAYAYEKSGQDVTLHIYDPNESQVDVQFRFNITATDGEVHIDRWKEQLMGNTYQLVQDNDKHIYCFFRVNGYAPKSPPQGQRFTSVKEAIRATSSMAPPYSVKVAMELTGGSTSVADWMRSL